MSISWKSTYGSFPLAVILTMGGCLCFASSPGDENESRFTLDAGVASAREQADGLRLLTGYNADPGECGDVMLGPLPKGKYSGKEAWLKLIGSVCSLVERPDRISGGTKVFADMSECKCRFGLPPLTRLQQAQVLVERSALPRLQGVVLDRQRIEETGAASVPDLLSYISQTAFNRSRGFRVSGAQYAELRGLGAGYALVLVNGRRAFGSATDLTTNAFDLSSIPISAVERVEVSMDATSLVHGMDAIGGIVNVVLKDSIPRDFKVRYGSARGGASESHVSVSGGTLGERGRMSVFLEAERWSELLGRERNRWNNQDFTRFGGLDYRSRFASPANVGSMDGQNLPGLGARFAVAALDPATGMFDFAAGQQNSTSLRQFQAIVPEGSRAAMSANGSFNVGASVASLELLALSRENELQLMPSFIPGYTWGANHPENPFDVPIRVDAALAGLPAQRQHFKTNSLRGVAAIDGPLGDWEYSAFVVRSDERTKAHMLNVVDPVALARALQAADENEALSLYSTVRRVPIPAGIFVKTPMERYQASTTHLQASTQGSLLGLTANLGVERRHESLTFDTRIDGASRDITSTFAHVRVPLIDPTMSVPAVEDLKVLLGARLDRYSDVGTVTKTQFGLTWRMTEALKWQASVSESFRPPSLVELYFPRSAVTAGVFDSKRNQAASIDLMTGGNPSLHPTAGRSSSVGVTFQTDEGLRLSAEYWRVKVRDHISLLAPLALLANEDSALEGRIVRAAPTAEDAALGQPGRLLNLDISRANVGGATTQGVDLAAEAVFKSGIGSFKPRLSVTLTNKFAYSELPITQIRLENRVGVASELGTIPAQRGVASLTYENKGWRAYVQARAISSYRDRNAITGEPMQRMVSGGAVWDLNVSKKIIGNVRLTLGAFNVTNREPPYAHAGGSLGFDTSQGDLEGRQIYGTLSGTF